MAESATAGKKVVRVLDWHVQAKASNGYEFNLQAVRTTNGGASVVLSFSNGVSSAQYVQRRPVRVTKRRLIADFGAIGSIDLRRTSRFRDDEDGNRCERLGLGFGRLKGGLRIEGEGGFSRVRDTRVSGLLLRFTSRRGCKGKSNEDPLPIYRPLPVDRSRLLISCGGQSGAGLIAIESGPGQESAFTAFRTQHAGDLQIIRTVSLDGATRRFDVGPGARSATLRPPGPFEGRAFYEDAELRGNLTAPLPGGGVVRMTPGEASLSSFSELRHLPRCFPPIFYYVGSSSDSTESVVATAVQTTALTRGTRRALATLGSR